MAGVVDWFGQEDVPSEESERLAALYDLDAPHGPSAAVDWLRGLAQMTGGPVLELGVGTGRVAIPLAKDGREVVGIDRSAAMLARAAAHAKAARAKLTLVEADMRSFSLERTFALVTIPFNTFLMLTPDERWACLARCREHLAPSGRLAIDVFQPNPEVIAGLDGAVREESRFRIPEQSTVEPRRRVRCGVACPSIKDLDEALHEVVGELEASVVATSAEERRVFGAAFGHHERKEPRSELQILESHELIIK